MKKVRILVVLCMVVAVALGATMTVSAENVLDMIFLDENLPEVQEGDTASEIVMTSSDDVTVSCSWEDYEGNPFTGTFEQGNIYYLAVEITANSGTSLDEYVYIYDQADCIAEGYSYNNSFVFYQEYAFLKPIDHVSITGIKDAVLGETPSTSDINVSDNSVLIDAVWLETKDGINWEEVSGPFAEGYRYSLDITVQAETGYVYDDYADVVTDCNGDDVYSTVYGDVISVTVEYTFMNQIDNVSVTGVTAAVIGETATTEGIQMSGGNITDVAWLDEEMNLFTGEFEDGKDYVLLILFASDEGCEYTDDVTFTVNGEEAIGFTDYTSGIIGVEYSFKTAIDKVEFTGLPEIKAGDEISTDSLGIPEGSNYTIEAVWSNSEAYDITGDFVSGDVYVLELVFIANDGYKFSDDCQIFADGAKTDSVMIENYVSELYVYYTFPLDANVISEISITIDEPVIGGVVNVDSLKVPDDANYEVMYAEWLVDGMYLLGAPGEYFEEGVPYVLMFDILPDEGVVFASNVKITVNGNFVELPNEYSYVYPDMASSGYYFGELCAHEYSDWTGDEDGHSKVCPKCSDSVVEDHVYADDLDSTCDVCGYERGVQVLDPVPEPSPTVAPTTNPGKVENPPTGSDTMSALLMLAVATAAFVTVMSKRRCKA